MWGGITVLLPYELYRRHGDLRMLQDAYPTIKGYLAFMAHFSNTTDGLVHPQGFVSNHLTSQHQLTFLLRSARFPTTVSAAALVSSQVV